MNQEPVEANSFEDVSSINVGGRVFTKEEMEQELAHMAMSFDLSVDAFLLEAENFEKMNIGDLTMEMPETMEQRPPFTTFVTDAVKDFFSVPTNWAYMGLVCMFIAMLFLYDPAAKFVKDKYLEMDALSQLTPTPTPTPPPKPTPTPTPTPPPPKETPTPPPLEPLKKIVKQENKPLMKYNKERINRAVSSAHEKLFVRDTAKSERADIDVQFTTNRRSEASKNMSLDNLGAGRKGSNGPKDGKPLVAIGGPQGSKRGTADYGATAPVGNLRKKEAPKSGFAGQWVSVPIAGPIAGLQPRCLNNPGDHIYGNIKIRCSNNQIILAWKKM